MKRWYAIAVVISIGVIILPMLLQNGIVQSIKSGADMKAHLNVIRAVNNGGAIDSIYLGQIILAYLLSPFANSKYLDTIYLWFSFTVLALVALTLYFVVKKLVTPKSAMLVVPITMCCTIGIFTLFKYGVIFNIINMYIILLLAIYFAVRGLAGKGKWNVLPATLLLALFCVFHATGYYLPFVFGFGLIMYVVYALLKHDYKSLKRVVPYCVAFIVLGAVLSKRLMAVNFASILPFDMTTISVSSLSVLVGFISVFTGILFVIAVAGLVHRRKAIVLERQTKIFLFILFCFIVVLAGGLFVFAIFAPNLLGVMQFSRIAVDCVTITAIATACMMGILIQHEKSKVFGVIVYSLVAVGCVPTLIAWIAT